MVWRAHFIMRRVNDSESMMQRGDLIDVTDDPFNRIKDWDRRDRTDNTPTCILTVTHMRDKYDLAWWKERLIPKQVLDASGKCFVPVAKCNLRFRIKAALSKLQEDDLDRKGKKRITIHWDDFKNFVFDKTADADIVF